MPFHHTSRYGFNPGSTHKISGDAGQTVARAVVTTTLSAAAGGITVRDLSTRLNDLG